MPRTVATVLTATVIQRIRPAYSSRERRRSGRGPKYTGTRTARGPSAAGGAPSSSPAASVVRSSHTAISTIGMPAASAAPTSTVDSAEYTSSPRPPAPITEAMTTMDRAIMIVWLRPSSSSLRASGSLAVRSRCQPLAPSEAEASSTAGSAPRSPSAVSRVMGGAA